MTYGLIPHKFVKMPLRKVTDMKYSRSLLGRMLGDGQFLLGPAAQDQAMHEINWVPNPDDIYRHICDTIFGPKRRDPDDDLRIEDGRVPPDGTPREECAAREPDLRRATWEVSHDDEISYAPVGHWEGPTSTGRSRCRAAEVLSSTS